MIWAVIAVCSCYAQVHPEETGAVEGVRSARHEGAQPYR